MSTLSVRITRIPFPIPAPAPAPKVYAAPSCPLPFESSEEGVVVTRNVGGWHKAVALSRRNIYAPFQGPKAPFVTYYKANCRVVEVTENSGSWAKAVPLTAKPAATRTKAANPCLVKKAGYKGFAMPTNTNTSSMNTNTTSMNTNTSSMNTNTNTNTTSMNTNTTSMNTNTNTNTSSMNTNTNTNTSSMNTNTTSMNTNTTSMNTNTSSMNTNTNTNTTSMNTNTTSMNTNTTSMNTKTTTIHIPLTGHKATDNNIRARARKPGFLLKLLGPAPLTEIKKAALAAKAAAKAAKAAMKAAEKADKKERNLAHSKRAAKKAERMKARKNARYIQYGAFWNEPSITSIKESQGGRAATFEKPTAPKVQYSVEDRMSLKQAENRISACKKDISQSRNKKEIKNLTEKLADLKRAAKELKENLRIKYSGGKVTTPVLVKGTSVPKPILNKKAKNKGCLAEAIKRPGGVPKPILKEQKQKPAGTLIKNKERFKEFLNKAETIVSAYKKDAQRKGTDQLKMALQNREMLNTETVITHTKSNKEGEVAIMYQTPSGDWVNSSISTLPLETIPPKEESRPRAVRYSVYLIPLKTAIWFADNLHKMTKLTSLITDKHTCAFLCKDLSYIYQNMMDKDSLTELEKQKLDSVRSQIKDRNIKVSNQAELKWNAVKTSFHKREDRLFPTFSIGSGSEAVNLLNKIEGNLNSLVETKHLFSIKLIDNDKQAGQEYSLFVGAVPFSYKEGEFKECNLCLPSNFYDLPFAHYGKETVSAPGVDSCLEADNSHPMSLKIGTYFLNPNAVPGAYFSEELDSILRNVLNVQIVLDSIKHIGDGKDKPSAKHVKVRSSIKKSLLRGERIKEEYESLVKTKISVPIEDLKETDKRQFMLVVCLVHNSKVILARAANSVQARIYPLAVRGYLVEEEIFGALNGKNFIFDVTPQGLVGQFLPVKNQEVKLKNGLTISPVQNKLPASSSLSELADAEDNASEVKLPASSSLLELVDAEDNASEVKLPASSSLLELVDDEENASEVKLPTSFSSSLSKLVDAEEEALGKVVENTTSVVSTEISFSDFLKVLSKLRPSSLDLQTQTDYKKLPIDEDKEDPCTVIGKSVVNYIRSLSGNERVQCYNWTKQAVKEVVLFYQRTLEEFVFKKKDRANLNIVLRETEDCLEIMLFDCLFSVDKHSAYDSDGNRFENTIEIYSVNNKACIRLGSSIGNFMKYFETVMFMFMYNTVSKEGRRGFTRNVQQLLVKGKGRGLFHLSDSEAQKANEFYRYGLHYTYKQVQSVNCAEVLAEEVTKGSKSFGTNLVSNTIRLLDSNKDRLPKEFRRQDDATKLICQEYPTLSSIHSKPGIFFYGLGHCSVSYIYKNHKDIYDFLVKNFPGEQLSNDMTICFTTKDSKALKRVTLTLAKACVLKDGAPTGYAFIRDTDNSLIQDNGYVLPSVFAPVHSLPPGEAAFLGSLDELPVALVDKTMKFVYPFQKGTQAPIVSVIGEFEAVDGVFTINKHYQENQPIFMVQHPNGSLQIENFSCYEDFSTVQEIVVEEKEDISKDAMELVVTVKYQLEHREPKVRGEAKAMFIHLSNKCVSNSLNKHISFIDSVKLVLPQDTIKSDTIYYWLMLIGNTVYHNAGKGRKSSALAELTAEVERVNSILGYPDSKALVISPLMVVLGQYEKLKEIFLKNFVQPFWFVTKCSHEYGLMLKTLHSNNNHKEVELEESILNDIKELDFVITKNTSFVALEKVDEPSSLLVFVKTGGKYTHMLQRASSFVGHDDAPIYSCTLFERTTVQEAVSMSRGDAASIRQLNGFISSNGFDYLFDKGNKNLYKSAILIATYRGAKYIDRPALTLKLEGDYYYLSSEDYKVLRAKLDSLNFDKYTDRMFFKQLSELLADIVFDINGRYYWTPFIAHLNALYRASSSEAQNTISNKMREIVTCLYHHNKVPSPVVNALNGALKGLANSRGNKKLLQTDRTAYGCITLYPNIPMGELWVSRSQSVNSQYCNFKKLNIREDDVVSVTRTPIAIPVLLKVKYVSEGVIPDSVMAMSPVAMYMNYGDADGDKVAALPLDNSEDILTTSYEDVMSHLEASIGYDPLGKVNNGNEQYIADHYKVPSWSKAISNLLPIEKVLKKVQVPSHSFVEKNSKAIAIQTRSVGTAYTFLIWLEAYTDLITPFKKEEEYAMLYEFKKLILKIQNQKYEVQLGGYSQGAEKLIKLLTDVKENAVNTLKKVEQGIDSAFVQSFIAALEIMGVNVNNKEVIYLSLLKVCQLFVLLKTGKFSPTSSEKNNIISALTIICCELTRGRLDNIVGSHQAPPTEFDDYFSEESFDGYFSQEEHDQFLEFSDEPVSAKEAYQYMINFLNKNRENETLKAILEDSLLGRHFNRVWSTFPWIFTSNNAEVNISEEILSCYSKAATSSTDGFDIDVIADKLADQNRFSVSNDPERDDWFIDSSSDDWFIDSTGFELPVDKELVEPVDAKVVEPVAAKVVKPVEATATESVAAKVVEPVAAEVVKPVAAEVVEPVAAKLVEPVTAEVVEPVAAKLVKPVAAKVVEPVVTVKSAEAPTIKVSKGNRAATPVSTVLSHVYDWTTLCSSKPHLQPVINHCVKVLLNTSQTVNDLDSLLEILSKFIKTNPSEIPDALEFINILAGSINLNSLIDNDDDDDTNGGTLTSPAKPNRPDGDGGKSIIAEQPEAKAEAKQPTKVEAKQPVKVEAKIEAKQPTKVEAKVEAKQPTKVEAKVEAKQPTKVEDKVKAKQPTKVEAKVEAKQLTKVEAKVEAKQPTKVEAKVEAKQPTKIEAKVEAKQPTKVEAKVEAKQLTKVEAEQPALTCDSSLAPNDFYEFEDNLLHLDSAEEQEGYFFEDSNIVSISSALEFEDVVSEKSNPAPVEVDSQMSRLQQDDILEELAQDIRAKMGDKNNGEPSKGGSAPALLPSAPTNGSSHDMTKQTSLKAAEPLLYAFLEELKKSAPKRAALVKEKLKTLNRQQKSFVCGFVMEAINSNYSQSKVSLGNFFLTGKAGTGKTYTVTTLIDILETLNFKVITTASTGIASTLYRNSAGTMNTAVGMGIGMKAGDSGEFFYEDFQKIGTRIFKSQSTVQRFTEGKHSGVILIVDEISMMGVHNLKVAVSSLEALQQRSLIKVKRPIQFLFVGNVEQFAPVKDDFFFKPCSVVTPQGKIQTEAKTLIDSLRMRTFELTIGERQKGDPQFTLELNNLAKGNFSQKQKWLEESPIIKERFDYSCHSELPENATQLFYQRKLKTLYNNSKIEKLLKSRVESHTFSSKGFIHPDYEGQYKVEDILRDLDIQEEITLTIGSIVRVKQNIYREKDGENLLYLANGSRGKIVRFIKQKQAYKVELEMLNTNSSEKVFKTIGVESIRVPVGPDGKPVGEIQQIPVDLGWASTMHGCQGLTLAEDVVIHAYCVDNKGGKYALKAASALYVSISRCVSKENLYFYTGTSAQEHSQFKKLLVHSYHIDESVNDWINTNYGGTLVHIDI